MLMYLKARPILLVCLTCSFSVVCYRCLTECNSRVDNWFILGQGQTVQGELSLRHTCGKDFNSAHFQKYLRLMRIRVFV